MHFYERDYDFVEVARRAVDEVRPRFDERNVSVSEEPAASGMEARGDPDKVRRAMIHLLDNAAKFTPVGGRVAVGLRRGGGDGGRWYGLAVADGGAGVAEEEVGRILEPFYQVDGSTTRSYGGVGLGLAFARRVAEAHGGDVEVRSPPDEDVAGERLEGTLVRLRVLAHPTPPSQAEARR